MVMREVVDVARFYSCYCGRSGCHIMVICYLGKVGISPECLQGVPGSWTTLFPPVSNGGR